MPLYKTFRPNTNSIIKLWKITESLEELMAPLDLKKNSKDRVLSMKSEIHQCGFLSVRHLLRSEGYTDQDLYYDDNGKPHLKDGKHISISHSFDFSGIIISDSEVGIDIEKQRQKIGIIAKKFVDYELNYLNENAEDYVKKLTIIWCIKESLYKLFATPGMVFKNHFLVIPFMLEDEETVCWIDYNNLKHRYKASFFEFDGFSCAYVIQE